MTAATVHCCDMMMRAVNQRCDMHPDPFDCADHLIYCSPSEDEYGLIIHDNGSSFIVIAYCTWCGAKLP